MATPLSATGPVGAGRNIRTPDDRLVQPGPAVDGGINQVVTSTPSPSATPAQDALEDARNAKPPPPREKAMDLLTEQLRTGAVRFLDISHSSKTPEELTIFVKDEAGLGRAARWLARKGHLDQPRTNEQSARFELRSPDLDGLPDGGDVTVRVAVAPPVDQAKAALLDELPNILKDAGATGKADVEVDGEKLIVKVDAAALDALRGTAGKSFMRASGQGLSWMGHAVELKATDALTFGPDSTPDDQKKLAEQVGAAWKDASSIQVRLNEGVTLGPQQEVCGFLPQQDGSFTLRYRPLEPKGGPFQEISSAELFKQGGEISLSPRVNVNDLTPTQRQELSTAWVEWIRDTNMIPMHEDWHSQNGSGGTRGPGSGERFMQFHANMMEHFKDHLREIGRQDLIDACHGDLPVWDTKNDLPEEFAYADMVKNNIGWEIPSWLTIDGAKPGEATFRLDGREIKSLNDLRSIDELGRALGESGVHAVGHVELAGQMAGFKSVGVGAFMLWHGLMEVMRSQWGRTDAGQAWTAKHPSGWTSPTANNHDHDHMSMGAPRGMGISEAQFMDEMKMLAERQKP